MLFWSIISKYLMFYINQRNLNMTEKKLKKYFKWLTSFKKIYVMKWKEHIIISWKKCNDCFPSHTWKFNLLNKTETITKINTIWGKFKYSNLYIPVLNCVKVNSTQK